MGTKANLSIAPISKAEATPLLLRHHYLSGRSRGFKSGFNYGCFFGDAIVGVVIFTAFPVPELATGMLGLSRNDQDGLFELSRLCLDPELQKTEHNLASWFLSRAIAKLRRETKVRVVLSYADSEFHAGVVYAACNFTYYGLTAARKDFWYRVDGGWKKHSRGPVVGADGEWRPRSRKHRFAIVYDKSLSVLWPRQKWKNQYA